MISVEIHQEHSHSTFHKFASNQKGMKIILGEESGSFPR
jgi:hypothetical protein